MRKLKLSIAFVIAIAAVGLTVASKASVLGSKRITACFTALNLTQTGATTIEPVSYSVTNNKTCLQMQDDVILGGLNFKYLFSFVSTASDPSCEIDLARYCCVVLDVDPAAPAGVPARTINGVTAKWKVVEVRCKP